MKKDRGCFFVGVVVAWLALAAPVLAQQAPVGDDGWVALARELQAIAGDAPLPLDAVPDRVVEHARSVWADLRPAEREHALAIGSGLGELALLAAIGAMTEAPDDAASFAALRRRGRVCDVLADAGRLDEHGQRIFGAELRWPSRVAPFAERAGLWALAQLVATHAEHPELPAAVFELADFAPRELSDRLRRHAMQQLGARADRVVWLRSANDALRRGDVEAAQAAVAAARAASASARPLRQQRDARRGLDRCAERVAAAAAVAPAVAAGDRIARLRFLQVTNTRAAVPLARELAADADLAAEALPHAVLAAEAQLDGDVGERDRHLARALAGRDPDMLTVALQVTTRLLPLLREVSSPAADEQLRERITSLLGWADGVLAADDSAAAVTFRALRCLDWPERFGPDRLGSLLPDVEALVRANPGSIGVHALLFAAAVATDDLDAAAAGVALVPQDVAEQEPALVSVRAAAAVELAVRRRDEPSRALAARCIDAVAAIPLGEREADYLRGVLAFGAGGDDRLAVAARCFERAGGSATEDGALDAASASLVTALARRQRPDLDEFLRLRRVLGRSVSPEALAPAMAAVLLADPGQSTVDAARDLLAGCERPVARFVLHAALAAAQATLGDRRAARAAARAALAIDPTRLGPALPLLERGVYAMHELRWNFGAQVSGGTFEILFVVRLLVLPELPPRERLRTLARDE
jgi:hypothetical protein